MLIVTKDGHSTRLERQSFPDEAALQRYISAYPEAIPLSEADDHPQLHVLGREFPTSSGPLDILGTDATGQAYIIETKLYKNPDKRLVLAQVLDYGAALWAAEPDIGTVLEALRRDAAKRKVQEPLSALAAFLGADEDAATEHLEKTCAALADGRFTAIVLMDRLDDRLRDLIRFMNENSRFLLLAVELDYYQHGETQLVYPRLFGAETRRPVKGAARSRGGSVDPETYLQEYATSYGQDAVAGWRVLEEAMQKSTIPGITIGHRPRGTPYIYLSNTRIGEVRVFILADKGEVRDYLHFNPDAFEGDRGAHDARQRFRAGLLEHISGAAISGSAGRIYAPLQSVVEHREDIMAALAQLAGELGAR